MEVSKTKNLIYIGANNRYSLLDVYNPQKDGMYPTVIFIHGFKGFKDWGTWNAILTEISRAGFVVISFNHSHNGGTVKNPIDFPDLAAFAENTYSKELEDLSCIHQWIMNNKCTYLQKSDLDSIYLIGHSRGGGIASVYASENKHIKKLITWAAVDSFMARLPKEDELNEWEKKGVYYIENKRTKQLMPMKYGFVQDLLENKDRLNIEQALKKLSIPYLIIHGKNDQVVTYNSAINLNTWSKHSKLLAIEKANHVFNGSHPFEENKLSLETERLILETIDFLKSSSLD